jgi:hypothetical protein
LRADLDVIFDPIPVTSTDSIYHDPHTGALTFHYVISHFYAELREDAAEPVPGDDCGALKWLTLEGLGGDSKVVPKCMDVATLAMQRSSSTLKIS